MESLLTATKIDASRVSDTCQALLKLKVIVNDNEDYGGLSAVEGAKQKAKKLLANFVKQFSIILDTMFKFVKSSKSKILNPTHSSVIGYFNERKDILSILKTDLTTQEQWKFLVTTLASGLQGQLIEYLATRRAEMAKLFSKILLEKNGKFSFLSLSPSFIESSQGMEADVAFSWQFLVLFDDLEGNELYWKNLLVDEESVNLLFGILYKNLREGILSNIDELLQGYNSLLIYSSYQKNWNNIITRKTLLFLPNQEILSTISD